MASSQCDIVLISWAPDEYRLNLLKQTITSLWKATTVPYRLIVVDNGREQQTNYLQTEVKPDVHIVNEQNVMPGTARNIGAERATAPYIAFVDNDILFNAGWLRESIAEIERYPDEKLIATPLRSIPMTCRVEQRKIHTLPDGSTRWYIAASNCLVMKRSSFDEIGPWPDKVKEDRRWAYRAVRKGYQYALLSKVLATHRGKYKSFRLTDALVDGRWRQGRTANRNYWRWLWTNKANMNIRKHQDIYNAVRPYLHGKIIDLGYGVTDLYKDGACDVLGIDISPEAQAKMQRRYPFGDWRVGNIETTDLPDKCGDTVLLISVLEHFPEYEDVLREAKRICRDQLIILVPQRHFDRDHRHPIWNRKRVDALGDILGPIEVDVEPKSRSWLITWKAT